MTYSHVKGGELGSIGKTPGALGVPGSMVGVVGGVSTTGVVGGVSMIGVEGVGGVILGVGILGGLPP